MAPQKRPAVDGAAEHGREAGATDGKPPDATDNANYFCEYAYLYHQMDMLEDSARTGTYSDAIKGNPKCFAGKVVLDVGAGSGILSIMAAQAGAKHVYAVEATDMAERARRIVEANGLADVITVLQGTVETIELPSKVDIIVSEWMGYFLLRESMLDSVLVARDKFLKPGGALFPSKATLYLAPVPTHKMLKERSSQWDGERDHWANFSSDMRDNYSVDFSCMKEEFMAEQRKYYLRTGIFVNLLKNQVAGPGCPLMELDLNKLTVEELQNQATPCKCVMKISRTSALQGFSGFFDVNFQGSPNHPAQESVTLSTAPQAPHGNTHWGQQLFGFHPPLEVVTGDSLECEMLVKRQKKNHRLLELDTHFRLYRPDADGRSLVKELRETYFVD